MPNLQFRPTGLVAAVIALFSCASVNAQQLGSISFPTSGAAAAQPKFIEGVKDLHSFEFDEAAEAFHQAQQIDPNFALAYWGEAMSYNHPLWAQLDLPAAKKALERLAPTLEGRLAKAHTEKEKAYLEAVNQLFYAPGDKLARDNAYSDAMARLYERWPEDNEVSIFYALSLLGSVRPADKGFRRQALAASHRLQSISGEPQPSRRRALHHSRFRRSGSRDSCSAGGACVRQDRAGCAARAAHAVAHLRPTGHVAGCGCLQHRGPSSRGGFDRANAPAGRARRFSHAVVAGVREPDAREV